MKIIKTKLKTKKTIICKNIEIKYLRKDLNSLHQPVAGDVAIFRVKAIGKHTRVQTTSGNNSFILPGDYIVGTFGNRYASEQFEGYIPTSPVNEYHILGQGGAIGIVASLHKRFAEIGPTTLALVGYVTDAKGEVINSIANNEQSIVNKQVKPKARIILSLGSGMDSGKTTSASFLIRGLSKAGKRVAYLKLTGTVYTRDKKFALDYGAQTVLDFSDFGYPSTYMCSKKELINLYRNLLASAEANSPDYIVIEIADGLYQRETSMLLNNKELKEQIYGVIYSSGDSLSAVHGANLLTGMGYRILTITGLFTTSPLLVKEVKANTKIPVFLEEDMIAKTVVSSLKM